MNKRARNIETVKKGRPIRDKKIFDVFLALKPNGSFMILNKAHWHYKMPPGAHMIRKRTGRRR